MTKGLTGIFAAVVTPLDSDGNVDLLNIEKQVNRLAEAKIHGVVTTGTTGEFPALTVDEHKSVIKTYVEAAKGRFPVVAGIGSNSTRQVIELAQFSEKVGAVACMIVPPFYDPLTFRALYKFYEDVCGSISIPVMYYNLPGATGIHLTAAQLRELGQINGFDYMKDTSGNAKELADLLTNPPSNFTAFNGWDTLTFFALSHGARAGVWGVATVIPKECVELYNTFTMEKNLEKAREQWKYLWEVSDFLESVNYPAGIKAGLDIIGESAGSVRPPTLPIDKYDYDKFAEILSRRKYK